MTKSWSVDAVGSPLSGSGQGANRSFGSPGARQPPIWGGAHANAGNLMGFLDPFKANLRVPTGRRGADAPSLTRCKDFA